MHLLSLQGRPMFSNGPVQSACPEAGRTIDVLSKGAAMKAVRFSRFGGSEVLDYVDIPRPSPQQDDILIEVTATGVNYPDIRERQGVYQRAETHVGGVSLPRVSGLQAAGRVAAVGPRGDRSLMGKKVVALLPAGG